MKGPDGVVGSGGPSASDGGEDVFEFEAEYRPIGGAPRKLFRRETWAKLIGGRLQPRMILRALRGGGKGAGEEGAQEDRDIDWRERFVSFPFSTLKERNQ